MCNPTLPGQSWCAAKTALYDELIAVVNEISGLSNVLLAPTLPSSVVSPSDPNIRTMVKQVNGVTYVFAYNHSGSPITANLVMNGISFSSVTVHNENRTIAPGNLDFTDTFQPYEAHVYQLQ